MGQYASQDAYEQALSSAESTNAPAPLKVKLGPPFTSQNSHSTNANTSSLDTGTSSENPEADPPFLPTENIPKVHKEAENFDGDRVLANSILFLQDFGWWTEIAYAIPEGHIGHAFEIMKVRKRFIFMDSRHGF